jgi:hypothetical protein
LRDFGFGTSDGLLHRRRQLPELFVLRPGAMAPQLLGQPGAHLLSVSSSGELAREEQGQRLKIKSADTTKPLIAQLVVDTVDTDITVLHPIPIF